MLRKLNRKYKIHNMISKISDKPFYLIRLKTINDIFNKYDMKKLKKIAYLIYDNIKLISPFIQLNTDKVCSSCNDVCCKAEHGYYDFEDLIYLKSLSISPPIKEFNYNKNDMCHFLTDKGCSLPREIRPSGCNWYFCEELLVNIESHPNYKYFDDKFTEIADLWLLMIQEFSNYCKIYE